jgi:hypothetical protein
VEESSVSTAPPPAPADAPRKSIWDTILTATPVALTVVATVLAGLSSGEMSRAQYHRALAAQDQSKTSDEWAFFQAKKLRATAADAAARQLQLQSTRQPFTAAALNALLARLADDLQNLDNGTAKLQAQLQEVSGTALDSGKTLREPLTAYRQGIRERLQAVKDAKENLARELQQADVQNALALLAAAELPTVGTAAGPDLMKDLAAINPRIPEACNAIDGRKPQDELDPLCNRISEKDVRAGLDVVTKEAKQFDDAQQPVGKVLDRIGKMLDDWLAAQAWAHEGAQDLHREVGSSSPGTADKPWERIQTGVAEQARASEAAAMAADRRAADFEAARLRYNARRYNYEARTNQVGAWLHEIQVEKSSVASERHRRRSELFFFGMLAAQAGVTVATLALALRRRSVLWSLAAAAGLASVTFAGYVYLFI